MISIIIGVAVVVAYGFILFALDEVDRENRRKQILDIIEDHENDLKVRRMERAQAERDSVKRLGG